MLKTINIHKFRKFKGLESIDLGSRLTLVSGANGIGKSTLLGIIASGSGTKNFKNLQNKDFHPEFKKYFILNKSEFKRASDPDSYQVLLKYNYKNTDIFKRLKLSHPESPKLVPRTVDEYGKSNQELTETIATKTEVTESGRIPIPTIYLSTSRLFPFGEAGSDETNQKNVNTRNYLRDTSDLSNKYKEMYNYVLPNSIDDETNDIVETKKPKIEVSNFYVPLNSAEILSQSVGQDSLSAIINSLLSFYNICDKEGYEGGILCIDELDISLHPDAQIKLLQLLKRASDELNLQIIFTSHSLTIIKEMLRLKNKDNSKYQVLYFRNNKRPILKDEDTYTSIKADLFTKISYTTPKVKVYLEDEEAVFLLEELFNVYNRETNKTNILSDCELIASQIGCDTLIRLPEKDSYFNNVLLVLDGDAKYNKQPKVEEFLTKNPTGLQTKNVTLKNVLFLPGDFSPESFIFKILYEVSLKEHSYEDFWNSVLNNIYIEGNYYPEIILRELEEMIRKKCINRNNMKKWFNSHKSFFKQSGIIKFYFDKIGNMNEVEEFCQSFIHHVSIKIQQIKSKGF